MAIGNPLLATWDTTGVLRMFEYTGGAFVQTGSLGGFTQANSTPGVGAATVPFLYWMADDVACAIVHEVSSSILNASSVSAAGSLNNTVVVSNSATLGPFRAAGTKHAFLAIERVAWAFDGNTLATQHVMSAGGVLSGIQSNTSLGEHHKKVWIFSPDGLQTFWRTTEGDSTFAVTTDPLTAVPVVFTDMGDPGFLIDVDLAVWAYDNKTMVIADVDASRVQSWIYNGGMWSLVQELTIPVGTIQHLAMSPDTRKFAVSTLDGGTYRTKTYRRTGSFFIAEQDFAGVGRLLDFSADGNLLIDSANQVAYAKQPDDSFLLDAGVMVNVPTSSRSQALSQGRVDPFGIPYLYNAAVAAFADKTANLANLKLTLLTDAAAFDPSHTTFSQATNASAWEITSGGWPAGGVAISGVVSESGAGYFSLKCDQVTHTLIETGSSFRNMLIYDTVTGQPLIFVDLVTERAYAKNRELMIDFRGGEFLRFST